MAKTETKYGKYILKEPIGKAHHSEITWPTLKMSGDKDFEGAPVVMVCDCISTPFAQIKVPHAHEFDQFLVFLGGNPTNMKDFGAEVQLSLGAEGEKHLINTCAIVHIPKGLIHGPLIYKKVPKPILFIDVGLTPTYVRK